MSDDDETAIAVDWRDHVPTMQGRRDLEMNVIGWLLFIGLLIVMIPLLPAIILAVAIAKLLGYTGDRQLSWPRPWARKRV